MSKVYLLSTGDYSDYRVVAAFSTREKAELVQPLTQLLAIAAAAKRRVIGGPVKERSPKRRDAMSEQTPSHEDTFDDWDQYGRDRDEEVDEFEEAVQECGLLPAHLGGGCTLAGTEHCDFDCPFRDNPELLTGDDDEDPPAPVPQPSE